MQPATVLPGLEHLLEVCRSRAHPLKLEPPLPIELTAESSVAGQPMDSQLAAVHARVGYLWVRDGFSVLPVRHEWRPDLYRVNEQWRREWAEPFGSLRVFARDDRLAYCYATVPGLAGERGAQPVVWVDVYEALYAVPVASDVDHFFDTYARYLAATPRVQEGEEHALLTRTFPWSAADFIARDRALVELIQAGRFDFLMKASARAREWVETRLGAPVRR
jgi:hypothetical protein